MKLKFIYPSLMLQSIVQYSTVHYYIVLYSRVQYNTFTKPLRTTQWARRPSSDSASLEWIWVQPLLSGFGIYHSLAYFLAAND